MRKKNVYKELFAESEARRIDAEYMVEQQARLLENVCELLRKIRNLPGTPPSVVEEIRVFINEVEYENEV